jgi:hypothetical protein
MKSSRPLGAEAGRVPQQNGGGARPAELLAWDAPRNCDYCEKPFKPVRPQDAKQHFCCDNCRKNFFRYGEKQKIVAALSRVLRGDIAKLEKRIVQLERQVKHPQWHTPPISEVRRRIRAKAIDSETESVVTFQPEVTQ